MPTRRKRTSRDDCFFVSSRLIMILHGAAVRLQFGVEFINFQFVRHYCAQILCAIIVRSGRRYSANLIT